MMFLLFDSFLSPSAILEIAQHHKIDAVIDDIKIITPLSIIVTGTIKGRKYVRG